MRRGLHRAALLATLLLPATAWPHAGHTDRQPWDVCAGQRLGSDCSWIAGDHTLRAGSCREIGGALMCVRTKPIVPAPTGALVANPLTTAWPWVAGGMLMLVVAAMATLRAQRRRPTSAD